MNQPTQGMPETVQFNPGGAVLPLLGRYDSVHLARYLFAASQVERGRFLDFGCGYGFGAAAFARLSASEGIGVDVDARCIDYASRHFSSAQLGFVKLIDMSLPVVTGSLSAITAFEVLEHLAPTHLVSFLEESVRVLGPNGILVGSTPNGLLSHSDDFVFHLHELSLHELSELAKRFGYQSEVYGLDAGNGSNLSVVADIAARLPKRFKRSYLLKVFQSLGVSLASSELRAERIARLIGAGEPELSPDLIFVFRRHSGNESH